MDLHQKLKEQLKSAKKITLVSHKNPDGDAIGSTLGLYHVLKQSFSAEIIPVMPNDYPAFLQWLPGNDEVEIYCHNSDYVRSFIAESDLVICLDFNDLNRLDKLGDYIYKQGKPLVLIDHHLEPRIQTEHKYWDTKASSASEMVYRFVELLGLSEHFSKDSATCLMTGLITDTGRFKFSTTAETFRIAGELMRYDVNLGLMNNEIFDSFSYDRLDLFAHSLSQKMVYWKELKSAVITLSLADKEKFHFQPGDSEGLVNFPLMVYDIDVAALLIENEDGSTKISLRSKGDFSVQKIASKHFFGGGHKNASGGKCALNLKETTEKLKLILAQ